MLKLCKKRRRGVPWREQGGGMQFYWVRTAAHTHGASVCVSTIETHSKTLLINSTYCREGLHC